MAIIVLLLLLLIIIFSIPAVQTFVAKKVTDGVNETYGTDITIHRLGLNWKGEVDIRDIFIKDHHKDTLIFAQEVQTNILSFHNLMNGDLGFGDVDLTQATLRVKTYLNEEDDNLFIFSEKFNTGATNVKPFSLFSNNVSMVSSKVSIVDENLENPTLIDLRNVNVTADDFKIAGPNVEAQIRSLTLDAARGYSISSLETDFSYTLERIDLKNLKLETSNSFINGDVALVYGDKGLGDFVNNVNIEAVLENSSISTTDLNSFYDEFTPNLPISFDGTINGILNNFELSKTNVKFGSSRLRGKYQFKHLFNEDAIYIVEGTDHSITTNYFDLRRLMPNVIGAGLPEELKSFGSFTFTGDSKIEGDLLLTDSRITSAAGNFNTQLEMGNINDFDNAFYKGEVLLEEFNLGKITGSISFGNVNADLIFDGRGFTPKTVNTRINGTIESFSFEGYNYKDIAVSGNLKDPIFNGQLKIDDPNLKMDFSGLVDISKDFNQYDFEANVEYAELNKLNLFTRDSVSVFAGRVIMDMQGTTVDDAVGNIEFLETFYQTETDDYFFDDFLISSFFTEEERTIEIKSPDIVNGEISGKFFVNDIPNLFRNSIGSIYANYIPNEVTNDQYINYEFEVYNKIVEVFVPQIQLGENTRVKGSVYSDESKFKLDFKSPELLLMDNYLGKVNIQLDNDNPLFNAYVSVDSVDTGFYNVSDLSFINKTLNDTLYIQTDFKGGKKKNDLFNMSLYHTINPQGKSVVGVKRSKITYLDNDWFLNRDNNSFNKLTFDNNFKDVVLDSLTLRHNEELIKMKGVVRDSLFADLQLDFTNVDVGKLIPTIDSLDLKGNINGNLNVLKKGGAFYPNSEIVVDHLQVNDIDYGDLNLNIKGNTNLTRYTINSSLVNERLDSFTALGYIDVAGQSPTIDMDVDFKNFNAAGFSSFGGDVITDIRGFVTGNIAVEGNYKSPNMDGVLTLNESGINIPYLNVDLDLEDGTLVEVSKNKFNLPLTDVTDTKYKTNATLKGNFTHDNFDKWAMDLFLETDRFLVLDTPQDDESLYYGTAFISGEAAIKGPVDELVIDVLATTEEGTTFKIPISDAASIGDDSFIRFISPEEKQARISGETIVKEDLKGLSLNFELDINEKAEVEVVVDQVNNSTLKGRGAGILLLEINTLGKFKMWGDFLVIEGKYDFRYGGLVDKTIDVLPGGNITWDGSPTKARLDLTAKYETTANPANLLDNPGFNRKIPVNVLVDLSGEILKPELDFRIEFPRVSSTVRNELDYKLQNKEQRQTQALYLVSTGSFQNESAGAFTTSNFVAERVNKLVADIFSNSDSKFKVLPSFTPRNNIATAQTEYDVGVELRTQISERILINGKVGVPIGGANESTVAGDIEVQWLVNDDGSLRINFFNRQADLQFIGEDQIFEQGAGVSYSVDFDTFNELMQKLFNKKLTLEPEEELPIIPDDNYPVNFKAPNEN